MFELFVYCMPAWFAIATAIEIWGLALLFKLFFRSPRTLAEIAKKLGW